MSKENNHNNSFKMSEYSNRHSTNEENNNDNIVNILPGKHQKLIEEKDINPVEMSKNQLNKKKKQCNYNSNYLFHK